MVQNDNGMNIQNIVIESKDLEKNGTRKETYVQDKLCPNPYCRSVNNATTVDCIRCGH